jgi:hypothetical protein
VKLWTPTLLSYRVVKIYMDGGGGAIHTSTAAALISSSSASLETLDLV